jgi:hypothetical protein
MTRANYEVLPERCREQPEREHKSVGAQKGTRGLRVKPGESCLSRSPRTGGLEREGYRIST